MSDLLELPGGDWIAGGGFVRGIARWDGENWHPLGAGVSGRFEAVAALALLPSGELFAGGGFDTAGAEPAFNAALWDGDEWRSLSRGINADVRAVMQLPEGDLVISGDFVRAPDGAVANRIARWDGEDWTALGGGLNGPVMALARLPGGDVVAGGAFMAGSIGAGRIARWDGSEWHSLDADFGPCGGCGLPSVRALTVMPNGDLIAGGSFQTAGGVEVGNIARWDGGEWSLLGGGMNGAVASLLVLPSGDLVAGGSFTTAGGVAVSRIAQWDGVSWRPLGSGLGGSLSSMSVSALALLAGGDLVAAGWFTRAGGISVYGIARWDGSEWSPFGTGFKGGASGLSGNVYGLAVLPNGDLIAGGNMWQAGGVSVERIARWDGAQWHAMDEGVNSPVWGLTVLPTGELLAVGGFTMAGNHVSAKLARWGCSDAPCYADCDGSGSLDFFDFLCFQNLFAAQDPAADCDDSGGLDFFDFLCFQNAFAAGCP